MVVKFRQKIRRFISILFLANYIHEWIDVSYIREIELEQLGIVSLSTSAPLGVRQFQPHQLNIGMAIAQGQFVSEI
jgi:hypothetical protein